uniref:Uncharacterized protein n=1 Tax=Parascaris univalens TaxID=6257 RepID=A0A915C1A6_PARUN
MMITYQCCCELLPTEDPRSCCDVSDDQLRRFLIVRVSH